MHLPYRHIVLTVVIAVAAVGWFVYDQFFKDIYLNDRYLGNITYNRAWGRIREVQIDPNRDQVVDFRGIYSESLGNPSHHDPFESSWESVHCNGKFDLRIVYDGEGVPRRVEYDRDGDGQPDQLEEGQEARRLISALRQQNCLGSVFLSQ